MLKQISLLLLGILIAYLGTSKKCFNLDYSWNYKSKPFKQKGKNFTSGLIVEKVTTFETLRTNFANNNVCLIAAYNQFSCLRCFVSIKNLYQTLQFDPQFINKKIALLFSEVTEFPYIKNFVRWNVNEMTLRIKTHNYALEGCKNYMSSRNEKITIRSSFLKCIKREVLKKIKRYPKEVFYLNTIKKKISKNKYIGFFFGSSEKHFRNLFYVGEYLEHPFYFTSNRTVIGKIGRNYRGFDYPDGEHFCMLRNETLIDQFDPYQFECLLLKPKTKRREIRIFYLREKSPKIRSKAHLKDTIKLIQFGVMTVLYVKSKYYESEKLMKFIAIASNKDRSVARLILDAGSKELIRLKDKLKRFSFVFEEEEIYQIFYGGENFYAILKFRGELTGPNLSSFLFGRKEE